MLQKLLSLLLLLICCSFIQTARAQCNTCTSFAACVSKTEFQVCSKGQPTGNISSCNAGQICAVNGTCVQEDAADAVVACQGCGLCDGNNTFACTGTREFALCLGGSKPSAIKGLCDEKTYCNVYNEFICGTAEAGFAATCSYTDDPEIPTTPSPNGNPNSFCSVLRQRGRFPVGTDLNTTCRQYVLCLQNNETWIGALYYCPNNTYFNANTKGCDEEKPSRCSSLVRSLSIYGIQFF